jgi:hypothetical protein
MKMSIWMVLGIVIFSIALGLWAYDRFVSPQLKIDPGAFEDVRFPDVRGTNLAREEFELPADLGAEYAIVMIAFQQYQQLEVNTWIPIAQEYSARFDALTYYEFPTIDRLNPAARAFIDGGMRAGIPDPIARATTITLYLDKPAFRKVLDIPGEDQIVVMLINREGEVFWRVEGPSTTEAIEELDLTLRSLLG